MPEDYVSHLTAAGESVVEKVGKSLKTLHQRIDRDPGALLSARDEFFRKTNRAVAEWSREYQVWTKEDLARAYVSGVSEADKAVTGAIPSARPTGSFTPSVPVSGPMVAVAEPSAVPSMFAPIPKHLTAYAALQQASQHYFKAATFQVLRTADDLYRTTAFKAMDATFKEADIFTRRALSQSMLDDFANRGVRAITYANGREMSIESYAEMVGRTMTLQAQRQGKLNRCQEYGYNLIRISAHFRCCPLCAPWEGRVLSQDGNSKNYPSLMDAIDAGLFHPNCLHTFSPYFPGISPKQEVLMDPGEKQLVDKHGYEPARKMVYQAQERQRTIERHIREWKRREIVALDNSGKLKARLKVQEWQAAQRQHITSNPFLARDYERESITRAH